jgi:hypothetical protein
MEAIADRRGRVSPVALWRAARDPRHPLHHEYNWNVQEAAEAHWTETSKALMREVRVVVIEGKDTRYSVVGYVHDPEDPGFYIPTIRIASREEIALRVLREEVERIEGHIIRARGLSIAFRLQHEFERLLMNTVDVRKKVRAIGNGSDKRRRRASLSASV